MANIIQTKYDARAVMTITLANKGTGVAQQSTLIDNTSLNRPGALIFLRWRSGSSTPTAGTTVGVYLIRKDGTNATDNAGTTDAVITIENAPLLGSIVVTNTTGKDFWGEFDTGILGPLSGTWGIAVRNNTGTTSDTTGGNFVLAYQTYYPEVQ